MGQIVMGSLQIRQVFVEEDLEIIVGRLGLWIPKQGLEKYSPLNYNICYEQFVTKVTNNLVRACIVGWVHPLNPNACGLGLKNWVF
jgi:hypothetical protein